VCKVQILYANLEVARQKAWVTEVFIFRPKCTKTHLRACIFKKILRLADARHKRGREGGKRKGEKGKGRIGRGMSRRISNVVTPMASCIERP
jgi:hypothetical protein